MRKNLTRAEILRNKAEIAELFAGGKPDASKVQSKMQNISVAHCLRCQTDGLKLIFLIKQIDSPSGQLVFKQLVFVSPTKSLGNAVQRNRAKRLQREFYRHSKEKFRALALKTAQKKGLEPASFACHVGLVIHRPATEQDASTKAKQDVGVISKRSAKALEFSAESQRFQNLLSKLERVAS